MTYIHTPITLFNADNNTLITSAQDELQWYKDNLPFGTKGLNAIELDQEAAVYYVSVMNENCTLISESFTVETVTGIDANLEMSGVSVYPNPIVDQLTIELINNSEYVSGEIINTSGKVIVSNIRFENEKSVVSTSELPAGVYILRLSSRDQSQNIKLLKQ